MAVTVAGLALLASCGSTQKPQTPAPQKPKPAAHPKPSGARIGKTLSVKTQSTTLGVTVQRVIDPLSDSGAAVEPGSRPIGVKVSVTNRGSGIYDGSSKSDFSLLTTGNQQATLAYAPQGECATPEVDFLRQLGSGRTGSGCLVFELPKGEPATRVTFSSREGGGPTRSWIVR